MRCSASGWRKMDRNFKVSLKEVLKHEGDGLTIFLTQVGYQHENNS